MNRNAFEAAEEASPLFLSESSDDERGGGSFTAEAERTRLHTTSFFEQSSRFDEEGEFSDEEHASPVLPATPTHDDQALDTHPCAGGLAECDVPPTGSAPLTSSQQQQHTMLGATENMFTAEHQERLSASDSPKRKHSASSPASSMRGHSVVYNVSEGSFVRASDDVALTDVDHTEEIDHELETDRFLNRPPPLTITEQGQPA
jgi:hypothetical protein